LAISSFRLNKLQYSKLIELKDELIGGKKFTFSEVKDEDLKDFW
jgi:hypothetical protein